MRSCRDELVTCLKIRKEIREQEKSAHFVRQRSETVTSCALTWLVFAHKCAGKVGASTNSGQWVGREDHLFWGVRSWRRNVERDLNKNVSGNFD